MRDQQLRPLVAQLRGVPGEEQRQVERPELDRPVLGARRGPRADVVQDAQDDVQRVGRAEHRRLRGTLAPRPAARASAPDMSRPPSKGSTSTCSPSGSPKPTTKWPGSATPYTGAPARRATSIQTTDSRIGSPRRRRSTSLEQRGVQPLVVAGRAVEAVAARRARGAGRPPTPAGVHRPCGSSPASRSSSICAASVARRPARGRPRRRSAGTARPGRARSSRAAAAKRSAGSGSVRLRWLMPAVAGSGSRGGR